MQSEQKLMQALEEQQSLLRSLPIKKVEYLTNRSDRGVDARILAQIPKTDEEIQFAVEAKSRSHPQAVLSAVAMLRRMAEPNEHPLVYVPYLSPERLEFLEEEEVSGIDLCGNGIITIPNRLLIVRSGKPNLYPTSRPVRKPFQGQSGLVARALVTKPRFESLGTLRNDMVAAGVAISLSQTSKAIKAMEEELLVIKKGRMIICPDRSQLLDKIGRAWRPPEITGRTYLKTGVGISFLMPLRQLQNFRWAVTGQSCAQKYGGLGTGGPIQVAVTNLKSAELVLDWPQERIPAFATCELIETSDTSLYFQNLDHQNVYWASRIQTWLELSHGDARQQEAARNLRKQILKKDVA